MSRTESSADHSGVRVMRSDVVTPLTSPPVPYYETPRTFISEHAQSNQAGPYQYFDQATLIAPSPSVTTSAGSSQVQKGTKVSGTCKLPITQGARAGQACDAVLRLDTQILEHHLRTYHNMPDEVNLSRNRNGGEQVLCPDESCYCRFRAKRCSQWDEGGDRIHHRTHVYNYLQHYKDVHLRSSSATVPARQKCGCCGKTFTRSESVARHKKKSCGKV